MNRLCLLADYPAWLLPGNEGLPSRNGCATWLHMLRPYYGSLADEFEIHWIVMTKGIYAPVNIEVDHQVFHLLPRSRQLSAMLSGYLLETRRILSLVKKLQPSIIHAWGSEDGYAIAATHIKNLPVLFSLQGCINECLRVSSGSYLMRLLGIYERYALKRLTLATGESVRACQNMLAINPQLQTSIVEYGVSNEFHKITRNLTNSPSIVFIGHLSAAKGIRELVDVMKRKTLSHIHLNVWGSGPEVDCLNAMKINNVTFHGRANREQVMKALSRAWALVAPTHCDTGPTIVKEARAAGVPVITTTAAGASVHVTNKLSGYVIEPNDAKALETSILAICASQKTSYTMGAYELLAVQNRLSGTATIKAFAEIYRSMIPG